MFIFRRFVLALQTLTRLPLPRELKLQARDMPGAIAFYPFAGLLAGVLSFFAAYIVSRVFSLAYIGALCAIAALAVMAVSTGALHMDGFADCCDALGSGKKSADALRVMKDSRLGTTGVLGLIFDAGLRFLLYMELYLGGTPMLFMGLALAPCVAKTAIAAACWGNRYVNADSANKHIIDGCTWREFFINAAVMLCAAGAVSVFAPFEWPKMLIIIAASVLLGLIFSKGMSFRLCGINGDVLGGSNEIAELAFIIGLLWLR